MFHTTFYLRRLHSLVGLLALGMVLFEHIFTNSMALGGAPALNGSLAVMELIPKPIFLMLEICGIAIPLLFHAIYGVYIALQANNNPGRFGYIRNWQFALQRSADFSTGIANRATGKFIYAECRQGKKCFTHLDHAGYYSFVLCRRSCFFFRHTGIQK